MTNILQWIHELFTSTKGKIGTKPDDRMGIRSGFSTMDKMMRGFHPGKLYIGVARPGCGKTSFCTTITANIMLQQQYGVLFISTELDEEEVLIQVAEAYVQGVPFFPNGRVSSEAEAEKLQAALFDLQRQMSLGYLHIIHKKRLTEEFIEQAIVEHCDGRLGGKTALVIIDQGIAHPPRGQPEARLRDCDGAYAQPHGGLGRQTAGSDPADVAGEQGDGVAEGDLAGKHQAQRGV